MSRKDESLRIGDTVTDTVDRRSWRVGRNATVQSIYMDGEMAVVAYETSDNGRVTVKLPTSVLDHV